MKKPKTGLRLTRWLLVFSGATGAVLIAGSHPRARQTNPYTPPPLSRAEERDLGEFTHRALNWVLVWWDEPWTCEVDGKTLTVALPQVLKRQQGKEVEEVLFRSKENVVVYLAPLHLELAMLRLAAGGLSPPQVIFLCQDRNDRALAEEERSAELRRKNLKESDRRMLAPDGQLKEPNPSGPESRPALESDIRMREDRTYLVPESRIPLVEHSASWSPEKKLVYERIKNAVRDEVKEYYCKDGGGFDVEVSDFSRGDPSAFLLMRDTQTGYLCAPLVHFVRNESTGSYDAQMDEKCISLPDELNPLIPKVRQRKVAHFKVSCIGK